MWKKLGLRFALALLLLLPLLCKSALPFKGNSSYAIAQPYIFSIAGWESRNLFNSLAYMVKGWFAGTTPASEDDMAVAREYFRLGQDMAGLQNEINRASSVSGAEAQAKVDSLKTRLATARQTRNHLTDRVEAILEKQVRSVLRDEGISGFPPIDFKFDRLPMILVTSPKDRIELKDAILLDPELNLPVSIGIEQKVEKLGISALVEGVGGLATYPSLVPAGPSLEQTLTDVAHEWVHQYLFFQPLGRRYNASYQMRTINETVANIVGNEIGNKVYRLYQPEATSKSERVVSQFDREMRRIRLEVDSLLAQGKVEAAERFMEESRQALTRQGYYIRKLNQAYFAFHGSYADTPISTSPAGEMLRVVRQRSASLGQFLRVAASISSFSDLEKLASGEVH